MKNSTWSLSSFKKFLNFNQIYWLTFQNKNRELICLPVYLRRSSDVLFLPTPSSIFHHKFYIFPPNIKKLIKPQSQVWLRILIYVYYIYVKSLLNSTKCFVKFCNNFIIIKLTSIWVLRQLSPLISKTIKILFQSAKFYIIII